MTEEIKLDFPKREDQDRMRIRRNPTAALGDKKKGVTGLWDFKIQNLDAETILEGVMGSSSTVMFGTMYQFRERFMGRGWKGWLSFSYWRVRRYFRRGRDNVGGVHNFTAYPKDGVGRGGTPVPQREIKYNEVLVLSLRSRDTGKTKTYTFGPVVGDSIQTVQGGKNRYLEYNHAR